MPGKRCLLVLDLEVPTASDQLAHGTFGGMIDVWGIGSENVDFKEILVSFSVILFVGITLK